MSSKAKNADELLKRERVEDIISSMNARGTTGSDYDGRVLQKVLVTPEQIEARVNALSAEISMVFDGRELTILPVLTGSLVFVSDLIRRLPLKIRVEPVSISSYPGAHTRSRGCRFRLPPPARLDGHDVLIVDDIYDSGETMRFLMDAVVSSGAAGIHSCALLRKSRPDLPEREERVDFVGFDIPGEFVVGYGLDYNGLYRNLPCIGVLSPDMIARREGRA